MTLLEKIQTRAFRVLQKLNPATAFVTTTSGKISFACLMDYAPVVTKDMLPEGYNPRATAMLFVDAVAFRKSEAVLEINDRVTVKNVEWTVTGKAAPDDKIHFALAIQD